MAKPNRRIVGPQSGSDRWQVKVPGARRASAVEETQADAIRRAREILGNTGGGELTITGRDGRIRDSDTIAPGNDPNPPKDTR